MVGKGLVPCTTACWLFVCARPSYAGPYFLFCPPPRRRRIFVVVVFTLALWQQGLLHRFAEAANGRNYSRRLFKRTTWAGDDVNRKKKKKNKKIPGPGASTFCCLCLCCDRVGRVILVSIFFFFFFPLSVSSFSFSRYCSHFCELLILLRLGGGRQEKWMRRCGG